MRKCCKRIMSVVAASMILSMNLPIAKIAKAVNTQPTLPKTMFALPDELFTTKDHGESDLNTPGSDQYILFGSYKQSSDGSDGFNTVPIMWRILSNSDGKLFLMSDKLLDVQEYDSHALQSGINWSNCELRTWLTGEFLNTAFTAAQQSKIANTAVSVPYATSADSSNFNWQTVSPLANQKIFLLSGDYTDNNLSDNEMRNTAYGFASNPGASATRQFELTDFTKSKGAFDINGYGAQWLRSDLYDTGIKANAFYAFYNGGIGQNYLNDESWAVAPALKIDLSDVSFASAADASYNPGELTDISEVAAMRLRFSGGQGTVTKTGGLINYASAPEGSSLVVVATDADNKTYQFSEVLTSASGSVDLSSKGLAVGSIYEAWVETEDNGILKASNRVSGNNIELTTSTITYKNYDGSDIESLPENYPTTYTEGQALTLPTESPDSTMSNWEFLGFWDQPLDQSKKVSISGPSYEGEQTLDLTVGNKITEISAQDTGNKTLYARYTSNVFDEDVNGRENYIFGAPGVFPNGSTASMKVLEPGTEEYKNTLQQVDEKDINNIKIVEFQVRNAQGEMIQPKTFFGNVVIGFKIPEGFNVDDISLVRIVANGEDITLRSRIWTDPDNSNLKYIEGTTDHFSPYAILSPWNENIVATGDNMWIWIISISVLLVISAAVLIWINRKEKFKKV